MSTSLTARGRTGPSIKMDQNQGAVTTVPCPPKLDGPESPSSRGEVREYRQLRRKVEELVGRINGRFTDPGGDVPVYYLYRGVPPERLLAYYRLADVCLVTPLADGMTSSRRSSSPRRQQARAPLRSSSGAPIPARCGRPTTRGVEPRRSTVENGARSGPLRATRPVTGSGALAHATRRRSRGAPVGRLPPLERKPRSRRGSRSHEQRDRRPSRAAGDPGADPRPAWISCPKSGNRAVGRRPSPIACWPPSSSPTSSARASARPRSATATLNVRGSSCDPAQRRRSSNRLRGADLLAVGTRGDHRVEGVAGEDDPLAPRGYRGSQCRSARARSGRAGRPVRAPEFRRESSRRSACRPHHPALEPVQIGSRSGRREAPGVVRR